MHSNARLREWMELTDFDFKVSKQRNQVPKYSLGFELCSDCIIERFSFECQKVIGFAFAFGFHAT